MSNWVTPKKHQRITKGSPKGDRHSKNCSTTGYIQLTSKGSLSRSTYERPAMSTPIADIKTPGSTLPRRRSVNTLDRALAVPQPGKRVHPLGVGTALVALVALGLLLVNNQPIVAKTTAIGTESDKSVLVPTQVTVAGSSTVSNVQVTTQDAGGVPVPSRAYSPDAELISSYENQIQELHLENDALLDNLESSIEEADSLREETLRLNEELLRLELALWKANEAAKGPVEIRTVYNITDVPVGRLPKDIGNIARVQRPSPAAVTVEDQTSNTFDPLGSSGELEIEVSYEDASPADQLAYDEYINKLGFHISYSEFRFSDNYKPADVN